MNQRSTTTTSSGDKRSGAFLGRWGSTRRGRKRQHACRGFCHGEWASEIGVVPLLTGRTCSNPFPGDSPQTWLHSCPSFATFFSPSLGMSAVPKLSSARLEFQMARLILQTLYGWSCKHRSTAYRGFVEFFSMQFVRFLSCIRSSDPSKQFYL